MNVRQPKGATPFEKEEKLSALLHSLDFVVIAYSGGLDSSYLADVAHDALGPKACMVTFDTQLQPRSELAFAVELARHKGWDIHVLKVDAFRHDDVVRNDDMRCYYCKTVMLSQLRAFATGKGIAHIAHGANLDDDLDSGRVGSRAAEEQGALAPLRDAGMTKADIRQRSAARHLRTADKAPFACLASRIPCGQALSVEILHKIELAEECLKGVGLTQYRARHHGDMVRIEIEPGEMSRLIEPGTRAAVTARLRKIGYKYVTLDLAGYKTGGSAAE